MLDRFIKKQSSFASHETAPLTIKSKSGLSAEGVAVLRSKTQKPVNRRQPSSAVSAYDCSSFALRAHTSARGEKKDRREKSSGLLKCLNKVFYLFPKEFYCSLYLPYNTAFAAADAGNTV